jgi:simple sugar transport system ATP-binding protein
VTGSQHTRVVDGVTFVIQPGEILGIAGVEGNGQTELIEAIAGLRKTSRALFAFPDTSSRTRMCPSDVRQDSPISPRIATAEV